MINSIISINILNQTDCDSNHNDFVPYAISLEAWIVQTKPEGEIMSHRPERQQRIYDFLKANPIGVLSTVNRSGQPHGSVIYYSIDENFTVSLLTKSKTRKYQNIVTNPEVVITIYEPSSQTTAEITGKAHQVKDSFEINSIAGSILGASLKTSDSGLPPISKLEAGNYVAFNIKPKQIKMAVFARPDPDDYLGIFETIESFELNDN